MVSLGSRAGNRSWALPRIDIRLLVGLALAAVALVGGLSFASQMQITEPVVVAARTIPAGHVIAGSDLTVTQARIEGASGALVIPEAEIGSVIGRTAGQTIHAGALVARPDLGGGPVIGSDQVAVTVAVAADAVYGQLRRGAEVTVMATSEPGRPQSQTTMLLDRATVYHVALDASRVTLAGGGSDATGRITNVTLLVPRVEAEAVTHALVNGTLTLLLVAPTAAAESAP
ncbi:MAG: hypothetical protein AMXMBFR23_02850 [Chloroflexota bacterium]